MDYTDVHNTGREPRTTVSYCVRGSFGAFGLELFMKESAESNRTERSRFTRMCIGESLIGLLEEKTLEEVHISEIVAKAGISRMTYYKYYHSKQEVLSDYLQEIVKQYIQESQSKKDIGTFRDYAHILHCLHFFAPYSDFIRILVNASLYSIIIDAVNSYMIQQVYPEFSGSVYELYYYAGALLNTFTCWIANGKQETPEEIASIISSFLK